MNIDTLATKWFSSGADNKATADFIDGKYELKFVFELSSGYLAFMVLGFWDGARTGR